MAQAILLTGQERRRRRSADDRLEILEAAFAPGANVSEVYASGEGHTCNGLIRRQRKSVSP